MATDTLEIFGTEYTGVTGIKATDDNSQTKTYIRPQGTVTLSTLGNTDVTAYATATVADANCVAANIKKDISIFGVTGTFEGGGGGSYPWFGAGTTFVERKINRTLNLKNDTSFDSWTASTTAGDIKAASSSADFTLTVDYNNVYFVVTHCYCEYAYLSGVTLKNIPKRYSQYYVSTHYPYPADYTNFIGGTNNNVSSSTNTVTRNALLYYGNTTGAFGTTASTSTNYGVYMSNYPSTSSSGTTVNFTFPAIRARCNTTSFATTNKAYIDSANTNFIITSDVYKTPVPNSIVSHYIEVLRSEMTSGL